MTITLQTYLENAWHDAAEVDFEQPANGYVSGANVGYDIDYYTDHGSLAFAKGRPATDYRAVSVGYPVDLVDRRTPRWPPFILDLLPQGHARIRLAKALVLDPDARSTDLPLLMRSGGSTIGNVRIKEAAEEEARRLEGVPRVGLTMEDILARSDRFVEVVDRHAMIASGSSGLQGEWPKVALTAAADGLFYPDPLVADDEAVSHLIVKMRRSGSDVDELILEMEAIYSRVAARLGLNVYGASTAGNGTLVIPRFDRRVDSQGRTVRIGQESMTSAVGVSDFGHVDEHERYVGILKTYSSDAQADVLEYLKRDAANIAMGNFDNHGRNTAISKYPDGTTRLSPLYDFVPMKLSGQVIARSTKWRCMADKSSDYDPDWRLVCDAVSGGDIDADALVRGLAEFADMLETAPDLARDEGADQEVVRKVMSRCGGIVKKLRAAAL